MTQSLPQERRAIVVPGTILRPVKLRSSEPHKWRIEGRSLNTTDVQLKHTNSVQISLSKDSPVDVELTKLSVPTQSRAAVLMSE